MLCVCRSGECWDGPRPRCQNCSAGQRSSASLVLGPPFGMHGRDPLCSCSLSYFTFAFVPLVLLLGIGMNSYMYLVCFGSSAPHKNTDLARPLTFRLLCAAHDGLICPGVCLSETRENTSAGHFCQSGRAKAGECQKRSLTDPSLRPRKHVNRSTCKRHWQPVKNQWGSIAP